MSYMPWKGLNVWGFLFSLVSFVAPFYSFVYFSFFINAFKDVIQSSEQVFDTIICELKVYRRHTCKVSPYYKNLQSK